MKWLLLTISAIILGGANMMDARLPNDKLLKSLKSNKISVVAPASGKDHAILSSLRDMFGTAINMPHKCFNTSAVQFHSASDEMRFSCFKDALLDKSSNVIWSLRGGYGSAKLIDELALLPRPEHEKIFIGYSDITALHLFMSQNWGWKTIHGAGIAEILESKNESNFAKLADIISGRSSRLEVDGLSPLNHAAKNSQDINGTLTGGNLTIVQTSIGTIWQMQAAQKIIFLEDIGFKNYQLDRTLYHLKQAGLLKNAKAIIFGDFDDLASGSLKVLSDFSNSLNIPVFKCNKFGHGKTNDPVVYNVKANIVSKGNNNYNLIMNLK